MSYRVLIVDDSAAMRGFVRRTIELSGFELDRCYEAADGLQALEILDREWVDAILTDINMPRMNGEEFLRRLAANDIAATVPVIVVSTDASESRMSRALELGASGYVAKPFTPEMLRRQLERSLGAPHA